MPKLKLPRQSTNIDMTAMCDVAFLLLSFFMLATKFKPDEPVIVKTPSSISEIPLPDLDIMMITLDPDGRIFFTVDKPELRRSLIDAIDSEVSLGLTDQEKNNFALGSSVGHPFSQLKSVLSAPPAHQAQLSKQAPGIPTDTLASSPNNELGRWIRDAKSLSGNKLRICIKADRDASYPDYKKIIRTLEKEKIFKFNLITDLKAVPEGTFKWNELRAAAAEAGH